MKCLMFLALLGTLASCGSSDSGDGASGGNQFSGTVSTIWNNIGIASAHAQFARLGDDGGMDQAGVNQAGMNQAGVNQAGVAVRNATPAQQLSRYSNQFLQEGFFTSAAQDYNDLVGDSLVQISTLQSDLASSIFISEVAGLDFQFGMGIAYVYKDASKELKEINFFPLKPDLSYEFKTHEKLGEGEFLKMEFLFVKDNNVEFRQELTFDVTNEINVSPRTSLVSAGLNNDLMEGKTIVELKSKRLSYVAEVAPVDASALNANLGIIETFWGDSFASYSNLSIPTKKNLVSSLYFAALRDNDLYSEIYNSTARADLVTAIQDEVENPLTTQILEMARAGGIGSRAIAAAGVGVAQNRGLGSVGE